MAEILNSFLVKDPDATQWPQGIDWTDYLASLGAGVTITASDWIVTVGGSDLTFDAKSIVTGNLKTQFKASGGTLGVKYTLTNRITTSLGGTDDGDLIVLIQ